MGRGSASICDEADADEETINLEVALSLDIKAKAIAELQLQLFQRVVASFCAEVGDAPRVRLSAFLKSFPDKEENAEPYTVVKQLRAVALPDEVELGFLPNQSQRAREIQAPHAQELLQEKARSGDPG